MPAPANLALDHCNTLALHANARAVFHAQNLDDVRAGLAWSRAEGLPLLPLGEGSNIVLGGDLEHAVLLLETQGRQLLREDADAVVLRVQAGENWHALVGWTLRQGYYGLENLALIPGRTGAAPIQNIGAYGVELEQFLVAVHGLDLASGEPFTLAASECGLGYRDSIFKHDLRDTVVITAVDLRLSRSPEPRLQYPALAGYLEQQGLSNPGPLQVFEAVVAIRRARLPDPAREPNAGSFFKNPVLSRERAEALARAYPDLPSYPATAEQRKLPAAWLIEQCGWKGHREDGVGVHPRHALVLVNYGANDGAALLALARKIQVSVAERFDISLEIEPRVYGAPNGSTR